jgi:pimeloyl-ACP methyl ester carboxylesterase
MTWNRRIWAIEERLNRLSKILEVRMLSSKSFSGLLAVIAIASAIPGLVEARDIPVAKNVVLVHGLYADGSSWIDVIPYLQRAGLNVAEVQNPLTSLADDVAATRRALASQDGLTVLVGHSFAGTIISEAGNDPKVSALVYVAARAPDPGLERFLAKRMNATTIELKSSHVSLVSHPKEIADLILLAAGRDLSVLKEPAVTKAILDTVDQVRARRPN